MIGLLFGLMGAVMIGTSDCVARITAQRVSIIILLLVVMALGLPFVGIWLWLSGDVIAWHTKAFSFAAASGILNLLALMLLYTAMARGPISVASPVASSFSVMLVGFNAVLGQPVSMMQIIAISLVFIGVAGLSRSGEKNENTTYSQPFVQLTAFIALGAAICIASRMILAQEATDAIGAPLTLLVMRIASLIISIIAFVYYLAKRKELSWPKGNIWYLVLLQAVLESTALASFLLGGILGDRISASVGFAPFSVVAAIIAWLFFKEQIGMKRVGWIILVTIGVIIAAVNS